MCKIFVAKTEELGWQTEVVKCLAAFDGKLKDLYEERYKNLYSQV